VKLPADGAGRLVPVVWPYVILGGGLELGDDPEPDVRISADGADWTTLATRAEGATRKTDFTPWFVARRDVRHNFSLRIRGAAGEARLTVLFQCAPHPASQAMCTPLPRSRPDGDARGAGFAPGRGPGRGRRGGRRMYVGRLFGLFALGFIGALLGERVDR
jgi:hypothetical protein